MSSFDVRYQTKIPLSATMPTQLVPLGYQQVTATGAAFALAPPANARVAHIGAEAQVLRWRDDGTNPTTTTGQRIPAGAEVDYVGNLATIKLIAETAGAIANVSYYG